MNDQSACDICGTNIDQPNGYQLTTRQVVRSPRFWRDCYERRREEFVAMGISSYDDLRLSPKRASIAEEVAGEDTPWLVCDRCVDLFDVDRAQAQTHAQQWWEHGATFDPPGAGPAPLSEVRMDDETAPVAKNIAIETRRREEAQRKDSSAPYVPQQLAPSVSPWPGAAALLNLTGLGAGYLYLKRMRRWLITLAVTIALMVAAYTSNAASLPIVWLILFGVWLLIMVIDGWRQAHRSMQAMIPRRGLAIGISVLIIVVEIAAGLGYVALGQQEFVSGVTDYEAADCRSAMQHFDRVSTLYELTFSPNVAAADARITECGLIVYADNARQQSSYADAVAGYETYLDRYRDSPLIAFANERAAGTYGAWAMSLRQQKDCRTAIEKYQIISTDYADTPIGKQVAALTADTYGEWATHLHEQGDYAAAIAKYQIIMIDYAATAFAQQAPPLAAETYDAWANELRQSGQYADALDKYVTVSSEYPDTTLAAQMPESIAATYAEWAAQLRTDAKPDEAVKQYEIILSRYADTPIGRQIPDQAAETYGEWAAQLRKDGKFDAAIQKYQIVLDRFAHTAFGKQANGLIGKTTIEWGDKMRTGGSYSDAIQKYQTVAQNYPDTLEAAMAITATGQTYVDWGQSLRKQSKFASAMEKFALAKQATQDAAVTTAADKGYSEALSGLAQDTRGEGRTLINTALSNACSGQPTNSPAINLAKDAAGKALYIGTLFALPSDLTASKPAHLRYIICSGSGVNTIESCPYRGGHTRYRQQYWWRVTVRDPRAAGVVADRTFTGSYPDRCPFTIWVPVGSKVSYESGGQPSVNEVLNWLRSVVR